MTAETDIIEITRRMATEGDAAAQSNLGWMHLYGKGVPRDTEMALHWYTMAAEQGDVAAQENLHIMYRKGIGVEADISKAVAWAVKSAESGNVRLQARLGAFYLGGIGVAKNWALAYAWSWIAYLYGYRPLYHRVSCFVIKRSLKKSEYEEAHRFIEDWQKRRWMKLR